MSLKNDITTFISKNIAYIIILTILYLFSTIIVLTKPRGFPIPVLESSETGYLFGPALSGFIFLLAIAFYLFYRYFTDTPPMQKALYQLIWGASFLIYSITFLGLCLQALEITIADMTDPALFLIWRSPMIIWGSGMIIGTSTLFTDNKASIYLPSGIIFILGEMWFILGLLILKDIELTMYGFLYWLFIPIAISIAILFRCYAVNTHLSSANMISFGFLIFGIAYLTWAPWHFVELRYIWYIWFNIFLVALGFIFAGFYALPKDMLSLEERSKE